MTPEHERYVWLRDGKSAYGGYCGRAPFVMSPNRSRLYAIAQLRAAALDAEVDSDIFHTTLQNLHITNEIAEREILPYPIDWDSVDYEEALCKLAQSELGWDDERTKIAKEFK
jgi:hypothetical protein